MKTKQDYKMLIERIEYNKASCNGRLNGVSVEVVNLEVFSMTVHADIIIHEADDNKTERFNDVEFDKNYLNSLN